MYWIVALKAMKLGTAFAVSGLLLAVEFSVAVYALVKIFSKENSEKAD